MCWFWCWFFLDLTDVVSPFCLQCFDTVGWAAGRATGLKKIWGHGGGRHWLVRMEWHPSRWSVCLPVLIFPCTIKCGARRVLFGSPGWSRKKGCKTVVVWCGGMCPHTKFVAIGQTLAEIWQFFYFFSKWQLSAILGLFCGCPDHPRRAFGGLYHCALLGWNRCSTFDNMQVFIFCELGLKTPIHALQNGGFWGI